MTIKADVLKYLFERPNVNLFAKDIAADMGIDEEQVWRAVNQVRSMSNLPGTLVSSARGVYMYHIDTNGKPVNALFEKIGTTKKGDYVLQDEDGDLYIARAID